MKRRLAFLTAALLALLCVYPSAAGGGAADPLISLSYLNGVFSDRVNAAVDGKISVAGDAVSVLPVSRGWLQTRLKQGDVLSGSTGTGFMVLAGSVRAAASGAVVDVTDGGELSGSSLLAANHRYLVAEESSASFFVESKTAVIQYQGPYQCSYSSTVDYNAIARALKALHLFQGTLTGYGEGFDLEAAPTRLQALIMFIRLLGEEDAALAWTGGCPFTDIAAGSSAARYVGYAYDKGYTNGYTADTFRPSQKISAGQYVEFALRALGYSSAANTDISDALLRAKTAGVLTESECAMLDSGPFLRAELVYISYYTLDAPHAVSGLPLRQLLLEQGVFTPAEAIGAAELITSGRLW